MKFASYQEQRLFRFWVQTGWSDAGFLPGMADGTAERACYFAVVRTQKRKSQNKPNE